MEEYKNINIEELDIDKTIKEAVSGAGLYLNTQIIKDNNIKKAQIVSVVRAYNKTFVDPSTGEARKKPFVDIEVVVHTPGEFLNQKKIFTLNLSNIIRMKQMWGDDKEKWLGKEIRFTVVKTNMGKDTVVVDSD